MIWEILAASLGQRHLRFTDQEMDRTRFRCRNGNGCGVFVKVETLPSLRKRRGLRGQVRGETVLTRDLCASFMALESPYNALLNSV